MSVDTAVLRSPGDLVANVPYLVGFYPNESIVAVWLKDGHVLVTQRADIEPSLNNPIEFISPILKHDPDEVVVIGYGDASSTELLEFVATARLHAPELTIRDVLWVRDGRWGSFMCTDPDCCPPEGKEIDPGLASELIVLGSAPVADRESIKAELEPQGTVRMKAVPKTKLEHWRDQSIEAFQTVVSTWGEGYSPDDVGVLRQIGRALHDIRVRDTILWDVNKMTVEEKNAAYDVIRSICVAMHPNDAAPACSLAAVCAWTTGDGARANVALDFSYAADPEYSLAVLLRTSLDAGLPPAAWSDSMASLSRADVRHGVQR